MASQSFHFHVLFHLVCNVMMTKTETNKESTTFTGKIPHSLLLSLFIDVKIFLWSIQLLMRETSNNHTRSNESFQWRFSTITLIFPNCQLPVTPSDSCCLLCSHEPHRCNSYRLLFTFLPCLRKREKKKKS